MKKSHIQKKIGHHLSSKGCPIKVIDTNSQDQIREFREQGLSIRHIASKLGISRQFVRKYMIARPNPTVKNANSFKNCLKINKEQIKSLKFKICKVTVGGADFYLRELSGEARLDFENEKDLQLRVLMMMHASLCDADGNLTEKLEDFNAFMDAVPNKVLNHLVQEFSALNIMGETHLKN